MSEHESSADPDEIDREAEERRPVEEAGGGEAEGFEQSEAELIEIAEGEAGRHHPLGDRFPAEEVDPEEHTIHGEADTAESPDDDSD